MLEGLDQIDWNNMGEPRIPEWIRGLAQNNIEANDQLRNRLVYLGSETWEDFGPASELLKNDLPILIVPFLIELLSSDECKQKRFIFSLLLDLLSYVDLDHASPFVYQRKTKEDIPLIVEISPEDNIYTIRAKKVFAAVYQGRELYKSFVHGHSPALGVVSVMLLEGLGELD